MIGEMVLGLQSLVSHKPIRFALNLFITSAKEVVIVIFGVCLFVCLFVCLLTTSRIKYWSDLYENFTRDKEETVKFWSSSASGPWSGNFFKDSSTLQRSRSAFFLHFDSCLSINDRIFAKIFSEMCYICGQGSPGFGPDLHRIGSS